MFKAAVNKVLALVIEMLMDFKRIIERCYKYAHRVVPQLQDVSTLNNSLSTRYQKAALQHADITVLQESFQSRLLSPLL